MPMLALLAAVLVLAPTLAQADEDCAEGWYRYYLYSGGNCYLFVKEEVTFDQGQAECEKKDARLVDLHVEAENSFVAGKLMMKGMNSAWTGGQLTSSKAFSWTSGANPTNWEKWSAGEPNSYSSGGSGVVISGFMFTIGKWTDEPKSEKLFYVCERGFESARTTPAPTQPQVETEAPTTPPPPTQPPATNPADCFRMKPNTQAHVADRYPDIKDLDACLKKCIEIGCYSLDWDRKTPPYKNTLCWIFTPPRLVDMSETNFISGVDHYTYICDYTAE